MLRMNNGLKLRIVRVNVDDVEYKRITDIMNLPDRYYSLTIQLIVNSLTIIALKYTKSISEKSIVISIALIRTTINK